MRENQNEHISDILTTLQRVKIYGQQVHTFQDYAADIYIRRGLEREFALLKGPLELLLTTEKKQNLPHSDRVFRLLKDIEAMEDTLVFDMLKKNLRLMEQELQNSY
jgi:hypothetical protein